VDRGLIYEALREALSRLEPPFDEYPDEGRLVMAADPDFALVAEAHEERDQAIVYAVVEAHVPGERRTDVALLLHRINAVLYLGNFELDPDDGEIRFKASIDFGGTPPTPELVRPLLAAATMTTTRYLPEIAAV
jgi:hypothetical protein